MNTIGLFNQPQGNVADKTTCRVYAVAASSSALAFAAHTIAYKADAADAAAAHAPLGKRWSHQTLPTPRFGSLRRG